MNQYLTGAMGIILSALLGFMAVMSMPEKAKAAEVSSQSVVLQAQGATAKMTRFAGKDRFNTARLIAEKINKSKVNNVVLATGLGYADALTASVLAQKLMAPILLVNDSVESSAEALNYISKYLNKSGKVYITGGEGVVGPEFTNKLNDLGFPNIVRLGGQDRYETAIQIAKENQVPINTPVIIASGANFPDALSISSFAAYRGWPILLVKDQNISEQVKEFLINDMPTTVYIAGGFGVVSESIENEISQLLPSSKLHRFSGQDRYETASKMLAEFAPYAETIYFATGNDFADALAGSVLAAQTGAPIVLVDSTSAALPSPITKYLRTLRKPVPHIFGGEGPVSTSLEAEITTLLNENPLGSAFQVIGIE